MVDNDELAKKEEIPIIEKKQKRRTYFLPFSNKYNTDLGQNSIEEFKENNIFTIELVKQQNYIAGFRKIELRLSLNLELACCYKI